ncbi:hypothetical protein BDC45DRAFT_566870 [Circinella umbellata]|nr:hypothetical protein BDC45DRAFT_566870 [Circinella umbellata]
MTVSGGRATEKAGLLIKPYLKKLVLQTHPDFFHGDPMKGKRNATSLQQLYGILNPLINTNESNTTLRKKSDQQKQQQQLEFYGKKARKTRIVSIFEHSSNEWQTVASFLRLCKQLDIDVVPSDIQAVQDMITKKEQETASHHNKRKGGLILREEFARALHKQSTTMATMTTGETTTKISWSPERILSNKLLIFGPDIDKNKVVKQWCDYMSKLEPERWWGIMPALVVSSQKDAQSLSSSKQGRGILIFSSDMGYSDMKKYLDQNLHIKRHERISMMNDNSNYGSQPR